MVQNCLKSTLVAEVDLPKVAKQANPGLLLPLALCQLACLSFTRLTFSEQRRKD